MTIDETILGGAWRLTLPVLGPGRPSAKRRAAYNQELATWCGGLLEIQSWPATDWQRGVRPDPKNEY
jgi:hypothetical protein